MSWDKGIKDRSAQGHCSQCCAIEIYSNKFTRGHRSTYISDTPWAIILPFSWNAGSCLAAPLEALVDKNTVTTMTLKIWVHNENSDFMSRKKGWWLETASYCSWDCSFFDIIASVLYRVVHLWLSISYCQQKWFSKSSILYISHWTYWFWFSCFTTTDSKPIFGYYCFRRKQFEVNHQV